MIQNKKPGGFSLIETIVTMSLFFGILFIVYVMIQHYGDVSKTEHSRQTLQQESRYMVSSFADELKEAGAVLTLAHTGSFLASAPFFNGIYPLNSTYFPDGIIIATGDPEAVTKLTNTFNPGETSLQVESTTVEAYDPDFPYENPQWGLGNTGIVLSATGYYVFSVTSASGNSISVGETPVYYSGLLSTTYYYDDAQGNSPGNSIAYPENSPVVRLTNFSIYLFREIDHPKLVDDYGNPQKIRQLIRVTDTKGAADPFTGGADFSVISENIWDMQISYIAYENFAAADRETTIDPAHHYFAPNSIYTDPYTALTALLEDIRTRRLKQLDISIIAITGELGGTGQLPTAGQLPTIGDNQSYNYLPDRKLGYRLFSFSIEPRNYNIIL
ncbi:MAG: hypothetical protein JSV88_19330 [Candidatus Aminicenantes bacterium]|nr:MAG: hypothetical protein JSV88_19330 [Candidatus Aminicenantes bacterium]